GQLIAWTKTYQTWIFVFEIVGLCPEFDQAASFCSACWPELLYAEQLVDNGDHFRVGYYTGKFPLFVTGDCDGDLQSVKWLAFLSCSRYTRQPITAGDPRSHAELLSCSPGHVNLGAGNLALCGTCGGWQTALGSSDSLPADMMDLSASQAGTLGASLSADLGAVLHELLHCLGLGHTRSGVMARGCDLLRLAVAFRQTDETCAACARLSRRPAPKPLYWFGQLALLHRNPKPRAAVEPDCLVLHSRVVSDSTVYRIALSSLPLRRVGSAHGNRLLGHVGRGGCLQEMRLQSRLTLSLLLQCPFQFDVHPANQGLFVGHLLLHLLYSVHLALVAANAAHQLRDVDLTVTVPVQDDGNRLQALLRCWEAKVL
uniref:Cyclic nucleotide-binding domain-containing protein n=1 Tax=Macrostomum lignano TaxID=282301 RepID=A0A1I8FPS5_9PLAT